MSKALEIENKIKEIKLKIKEFKSFSEANSIDLSDQISKLESELETLKEESYKNMTAWQRVKIARLQQRPTTLEYIERVFDEFMEFHGDRLFKDDPAIVGGIGMFGDTPVTVIGHQKGKDTKDNIKRNFGMPNPEGYRKALRLMRQAEKFNRPIVTFVDTPGAYCGLGAEERGQGEAIAKNLIEMSGLKVPILIFVIGEGGSGGALALGVGDRVYMLENSIYSVISPEGLSSILWNNAALAEKAANIMKLTAKDLQDLEIIDGVVSEPMEGAHKDIDMVASQMKSIIKDELSKLKDMDSNELVEARYEKLRKPGNCK